MSLSENYQEIKKRVNESLQRSVDPKKDVEIVAVSKTVSVAQINEAIELGISHFGENKVQEMVSKMDKVQPSVNWHMIGHLQRNKVKYIVDEVSLIHSLDSISLLEEINRRASVASRVLDCLIQVNVSGEISKYGISPSEVYQLMQQMEMYEHVNVVGLMTMAPYYDDPEKTRDCFMRLNELFQNCSMKNYPGTEMRHLSMGMSNDYEIAIQEGSNMVRIGSALFGERNYG